VGTRPLILPGAEVLVFDPQGRLLLQRLTDTSEWAIPGGMMEPGESFEQTARREILEETGLTLGALEFLGVYSGSQFYYRYPNGDEVNNVSVAYIARECAGTLRSDEESSSLGFYPLDALPVPIIFLNQLVLDDYFKKISGESP